MTSNKLIPLPKISDPRGNLSFIEGNKHIPFEIKRVFYIYDVPTAVSRGAHAHQKCEQFVICLTGGLDVHMDDGLGNQTVVHLNKPWEGLHIPPYVWASEENFDSGTVYLVLTSELYDAEDYFRDYDQFLKAVKVRDLKNPQ
jgi:dTDP-4-dehydrorhamnose 3,5-epimerase-like enzyme